MKRLVKKHLIFQEKSATLEQALSQFKDMRRGDLIKDSQIKFYGKASGKQEIIDYLYNDITTELWQCQKYLIPIKEKVLQFIEGKNFKEKDYNTLVSGYKTKDNLSSKSELGKYIQENNIDFLELCDEAKTKKNIEEDTNIYILDNEIYVYLLFSFSYYLGQGGKVIEVNEDNYDQICQSDRDFNQAFNTLFANEVLDIKDEVGEESTLSREIDYDTRDNCFVYINGELVMGENANSTHGKIIEKYLQEKNLDFENGEAYGRPSKSDIEEFMPVNKLGFGHISNNVAFIETDTMDGCNVNEIVNALRGKVQKIYTYPDEFSITRVARDKISTLKDYILKHASKPSNRVL